MGVDCCTYLVNGVKLPASVYKQYDIDNDERFRPYIEGRKGIKYTLLIDSMDEYCIFGKVLCRTSAFDEDENNSVHSIINDIDDEELKRYLEEIKDEQLEFDF